MCLYAPDVTQGADGRYYLYYVLDKVNVVSVAVCDTPAGKYEYLGNVAYPDGTLLAIRKAMSRSLIRGYCSKTVRYISLPVSADRRIKAAMARC